MTVNRVLTNVIRVMGKITVKKTDNNDFGIK